MTTHDISNGLEMCDRVAILVKGNMALLESADNIHVPTFEKRYFEFVAKAGKAS